MSVTVNGKFYSDTALEEMSLSDLKALALAEGEEIQQRQAAEAQAANAEHSAQVKSEAQILGEEAQARKLPMDKLEQIVLEQGKETERQLRQNEANEQLRRDEIERAAKTKPKSEMSLEELAATPGVTLEEIQEREAEERAKAIASASPEARAEQATRDLEAETRDLQFVHDSLQSKNDKALDAIVARKLAEQRAAEQKITAEAVAWMNSRPDYLAIPENGKAIQDFMEGAGLAPCAASYDLAYTVLKQRGQLKLLSSDEISRREQVREQIENPRPSRKSSSVSSTTAQNRSMYDKPAFNEDEAYELPLDELRRRADASLGAFSSRDSVLSDRTANIGRFGLPM